MTLEIRSKERGAVLLSDGRARWGGVGAVFPVSERRGGGGPGKTGPRSKKEGGGTIPGCALPGQEPPGNDHDSVRLKKEDNQADGRHNHLISESQLTIPGVKAGDRAGV